MVSDLRSKNGSIIARQFDLATSSRSPTIAQRKTVHRLVPGFSAEAAVMIKSVSLSEADILDELVEPGRSTLSARIAEELLSLNFSDSARETIRELLHKNNAGTITDMEKVTLENYLRVGEFLDLLQAKARVSLIENGERS